MPFVDHLNGQLILGRQHRQRDRGRLCVFGDIGQRFAYDGLGFGDKVG
jgi:hypothetical protein